MISIQIKELYKTYKLYGKATDRLKESLFLFKNNNIHHKEFFALDNLSLEIEKGETIGILGRNGSGKSTLLKIITGVLTPTRGDVTVNGRISALLELGAGFNMEYTGIENIYLNGTVLGISKEEMKKKIPEILEFADIGDFVYQPVKTYSSGMFARLAFSVAINVDPDILIIDEMLSVGDAYFTAKCMEKIREWVHSKEKTVIFVSHSLESIRSFCTKAVLLDKGKIIKIGEVREVTETYERMVNQDIVNAKMKSISEHLETKDEISVKNSNSMEIKLTEDPEFTERVKSFRSGTGEALFIRAEVLVNHMPTNSIRFGDKVTLRVVAQYNVTIETEGTIGYMLRNQFGQDIFGMNIYNLSKLLPPINRGEILEAEFSFTNILSPGSYSISLGLKPKPIDPLYLDSVHVAVVFEVLPLEDKNYVPGLVYVPNEFSFLIK
ncbi:ABC transporter ATP-binding protein [Paenibacillus planticolens]|uniref:ATP-binding cassette domain-containing protein n=1 Tax=Paenibacillus planticolens TaxID=2654976 RepID=A0ABX1ZN20_9BACL|nr:ABC transporter ATP-binding protein [Paenibacillus planticolens]NOV00277.1 ATP-binding cassette domain-containing protein [Paenibacillus planticolens]